MDHLQADWSGITVSGSQQRRVPNDQTVFQDSQQSLAWADKVGDRLATLLQLPQGWDGHNGRPVSRSTASYAMHVIAKLVGPGVPAPSIVAGSYGGLQIEWHRKGWDIEFEIIAPNNIFALARNVATGEEEETKVETDLNALQQFVARIAD
jgi:hypothetical protein